MDKAVILVSVWLMALLGCTLLGCTPKPHALDRLPAQEGGGAIMLNPDSLTASAVGPALVLRAGNGEVRVVVCEDAPGTLLVVEAAKLLIAEAKDAKARDSGVRIAFNPFAWPQLSGCHKEAATKNVMLMLKVVSSR